MAKRGIAKSEYVVGVRDSLVEVLYFDVHMSATDIAKIFCISKQRVGVIIKRLILENNESRKRYIR